MNMWRELTPATTHAQNSAQAQIFVHVEIIAGSGPSSFSAEAYQPQPGEHT